MNQTGTKNVKLLHQFEDHLTQINNEIKVSTNKNCQNLEQEFYQVLETTKANARGQTSKMELLAKIVDD